MPETIPANSTSEIITLFSEALNRHDIPAVMALMTDDCLFENTYPSPDGTRYEGQAAVQAFWEELFRSSPQANFEAEEMITCGDRGVVRWRYTWIDEQGQQGHVRGIDLFRVRDGKVAEKLAYVKG